MRKQGSGREGKQPLRAGLPLSLLIFVLLCLLLLSLVSLFIQRGALPETMLRAAACASCALAAFCASLCAPCAGRSRALTGLLLGGLFALLLLLAGLCLSLRSGGAAISLTGLLCALLPAAAAGLLRAPKGRRRARRR